MRDQGDPYRNRDASFAEKRKSCVHSHAHLSRTGGKVRLGGCRRGPASFIALILAGILMVASALLLNSPSSSQNRSSISDIASWSFSILDSVGEVGYDTSIAVDSNDNVHVSYLDWNSHDLKYATNAGGSWANYTLDSIGEVGLSTSIAVDVTNKVHISYLDWTNADLKYATNAGGSWVYQTLDSDGNVGMDTSIAVDSNNKVHIGYLDWTNYDLKYATNAGGSWAFYTLDSAGDVGFDTSIEVDSNDRVHISYGDWTNDDLKYATNSAGSWAYSTLDSAGFVGYDTSIAVDSNNKVHISYHDEQNARLKYATNAGGSWANYTIDSIGYVGLFTSIAVDNNNSVHISYCDYTEYTDCDLKYATNAGGSWTSLTLDSLGNVGMFTSIAVDSHRKAHIGYCDYSKRDLKYAYGTEEAMALVVDVNANRTSGRAPLTVQFTCQVSGGLGPYTYYWTFGDNSTDSSSSPVHTYQETGTYNVTLVVTDSMATSKSDRMTVRVTSGNAGLGGDIIALLEIAALGAIGLIVVVAIVSRARRQKTTAGGQQGTRYPTEPDTSPGPPAQALAKPSGQEDRGQVRPRLMRVEDRLLELRSMKEKGLISEEEYEARKKELVRKW